MSAEHDLEPSADVTSPDRWREHVDALEHGLWTAMLLDDQWRIRWVSPQLQEFLGESDPERLGQGRPLGEAWQLDAWTRVTDAESMERLAHDVAPLVLADLDGALDSHAVPAELLALARRRAAGRPAAVCSTAFRYVSPAEDDDRGSYTVKALLLRLRNAPDDLGWVVVFDIALPPRLVAQLARGDHAMYERMSRLVQPGRRAAAILFCDLQGSGTLSRKLPTAEYFGLIRRLWTDIDETVAANQGIVGKHAGDGATAFFLAADLGGASEAARAAVVTARAVHDLAAETFGSVTDHGCLMKVGVHWGGGLYMGQLVPGGRLDVTALGDEVNEAARIQEAAGAHQTLASKQLLEQLSAAHALELGVDTRSVAYSLLSELAPPDSKIVRDAGNLAVTSV